MSDQTTCNRLGTIENDIKSILTTVSALKSIQEVYLKEISELKSCQSRLVSAHDRFKGGLLVVYILLTIFGATLFQMSVSEKKALALIEMKK